MSEIMTKLPGDDYFGIALAVNNLSMMQDAHQQIARYVYDCMSKYAGPNHETECVKMLVTMQEAIAALHDLVREGVAFVATPQPGVTP